MTRRPAPANAAADIAPVRFETTPRGIGFHGYTGEVAANWIDYQDPRVTIGPAVKS